MGCNPTIALRRGDKLSPLGYRQVHLRLAFGARPSPVAGTSGMNQGMGFVLCHPASELAVVGGGHTPESGRDEAFADGVVNQFRSAVAARLLDEPPPVGFGGLDAHVLSVGGLLGAQALGDQAQDLQFAARQGGPTRGVQRGERFLVILQSHPADLLAQVEPAFQDGVDGARQFLRRIALQQAPGDAGGVPGSCPSVVALRSP